MRNLVFSDWHVKRRTWLAVNHNVCGLQDRVAEEAVIVQVLVLHVLQRFFVRGHALEPPKRGHHGQQQMQLRMLGNHGLLKKYALCRVEPRCQIVDHDLERVLRHARRIRVIAGQRMPIRDEVEALVGGIVL
jgi:hypothetical protein